MFERGTMRPIKRILGFITLMFGIGLLIMPDSTLPIFNGNPVLFGIIFIIIGALNTIVGTRYDV